MRYVPPVPGVRLYLSCWFILSLLSPASRLMIIFANEMLYFLAATFQHSKDRTLLSSNRSETILMIFTRKSNFSSIIVTKKIYHGRSAKARRYSIPLNPIDNTIQVTNGWRLPDTELHIFRFEITRNILSIKAANIPSGKTLAQIQLMSCCQTWKKVPALSDWMSGVLGETERFEIHWQTPALQ